MNILTGKCKEDFKEWWLDQKDYDNIFFHINNKDEDLEIIGLMQLPNSMKYGVLVDFFDSVGIYVNSKKSLTYYSYYATLTLKHYLSNIESSMHEARKQAIEKANELYNKNND